jgi:ribosome-associated toxin RatA of RatAB toxin-antitoxin module
MADVEVSRRIAAPADRLYALVSELTRMGEFSPENQGGRWVKGATGPAVGARFQGRNAHGKHSWSTLATVTEADPGQSFAFRVTAGPFKVATWKYRFSPDGNATVVTEEWHDERGKLGSKLGGLFSDVADRASHNKAGMEATLERLAATAESGA